MDWTIGNDQIKIVRLNRYLIINKLTGKIGWARIGSSRIKYISDNLTCFDTITLYLNTYEVHIKSFVSPKKLEQKENIQITLLKDNFKIIYKGYFNLQGIKNLHPVQVIPKTRTVELFSDDAELVVYNELLLEKLTQCILENFTYNQRLHGGEIALYFADLSPNFTISVSKVGDYPFFIVE